MSPRISKFLAVVNALGPIATGPVNPFNGWPGTCTIMVDDTPINVAIHVSGVSSHSRQPYELRFQNPATANGISPPVSDIEASHLPILLGVDDPNAPKVFIAIDGRSRIGRSTRFSILFHKRIVDTALNQGYALYISQTGEIIHAFIPAMLPSFIKQILENETLPLELLIETAAASGVLDNFGNINQETALAANRATRAVKILVRKANIGKKIREAYDNKCAMCGLASNLLQGAHIYPVEAPGSMDTINNGLSLCHNHHKAFDLHKIWVNPYNKKVLIHQSMIRESKTNQGTLNFLNSTWHTLALPRASMHNPIPDMFERRYQYYEDEYSWVR